MPRYVVYLENGGWVPSDRASLIAKVRSLMPGSVKVVDLRVGRGHVEVDLMVDVGGAEDVRRYVEGFQRVIDLREIVKGEEIRESVDVVREAVRLFNGERYWEAHEVLEGLWRRLTGVEKSVIHGLILVAAAFVHLQKDELDVFRSMLARALAALEEYDVGELFGLDVGALRRWLKNAVTTNSTESVRLDFVDHNIHVKR